MQQGNFYDGDYNQVGDANAIPGNVYEATGTISGFMLQVFPADWVRRGVGILYGLNHPDIRVLAVELNEDGRFRVQVTPTRVMAAGVGIAAAIAAGVVLSMLAGMSVERVWEVASGTPPVGPATAISSLLTLAMLGAAGVGAYYVWKWYR